MSEAGVGNNLITGIVQRIERLEHEKKTISDDITEVYTEAKSQGLDTKALRAAVRRRAADAKKLEEHEMLVDTYMNALQGLVRP